MTPESENPPLSEPIDGTESATAQPEETDNLLDVEAPLPPCTADPLSNDGLAALEATAPKAWRRLLRTGLNQEWNDWLELGDCPEASLKQTLLRFCPGLLPEPGGKTSVAEVLRARQVLRMVLHLAGDDAVAELDVASLERLRFRLQTKQNPATFRFMSGDRSSRAIGLVRDAVNAWRAEQGIEPIPIVRTNIRARNRMGSYSVPLRVVHERHRSARRSERGRIALAVTAGLWDRETRPLRRSDLRYESPGEDWPYCLFVRIRDPRPGLERWVPVPAWVYELIADWAPEAPDGLLFEGAPALAQTLRRLQKKAEWMGYRVNPRALRTTYQAIARRAGGSRELVRGTWRQPVGSWPETWHPAQLTQYRLCLRWSTFNEGPGEYFLDRRVQVPRRAPASCPPGARELRRRKRPAPLPQGLRGIPKPKESRGPGSKR